MGFQLLLIYAILREETRCEKFRYAIPIRSVKRNVLHRIRILPPILFHKIGKIKEHTAVRMRHTHRDGFRYLSGILPVLIQEKRIDDSRGLPATGNLFCELRGALHAVPIRRSLFLSCLKNRHFFIVTPGKEGIDFLRISRFPQLLPFAPGKFISFIRR